MQYSVRRRQGCICGSTCKLAAAVQRPQALILLCAGALDEVDWLKTRLEDLETTILAHSGGESERAVPPPAAASSPTLLLDNPAQEELILPSEGAPIEPADVSVEAVSVLGDSEAIDAPLIEAAGESCDSVGEAAPAEEDSGGQEAVPQEMTIEEVVFSSEAEEAAAEHEDRESEADSGSSYSGSDADSEEDSDG